MRSGEPTVSTHTNVRACRREARRSAGAAKACMPSMNDSSEPVESSSTRRPANRLLAQQPGEAEQHGDAREVVVGAGDGGAATRSRPSSRRWRARAALRRGAAGASRVSAAECHEQRAADDREHQRRASCQRARAARGKRRAERTPGPEVRTAATSAPRRDGRRRRRSAPRPRRRPVRRRCRSGAGGGQRAGTTAGLPRRHRRWRPRRTRRSSACERRCCGVSGASAGRRRGQTERPPVGAVRALLLDTRGCSPRRAAAPRSSRPPAARRPMPRGDRTRRGGRSPRGRSGRALRARR